MVSRKFTLQDYLPKNKEWNSRSTDELSRLIAPLKFRVVTKSNLHKQAPGAIISLTAGSFTPAVESVGEVENIPFSIKIYVRDARGNNKFSIRPWDIEPVSFSRPFIAYALANLNEEATIILSQVNGISSTLEKAAPEGDTPFDIVDIALQDAIKRFEGKKGATMKEKITLLKQIMTDISSFSMLLPEGVEETPSAIPVDVPAVGRTEEPEAESIFDEEGED